MKNARIVAIIHKATEGWTLQDKEYQARKAAAKQMGFLWGAYHFSSGANVADQVDNFLDYAKPDDDDLIALDFEPSPSGANMTLDQAHQFVQMIKSELGRYPVLYGGSLLRESVGTHPDPILANCPLWYARYRDRPLGIPLQVWNKQTLWQFTDGNNGPEPQSVDGIGNCDRNSFDGTVEELKTQWPFTRKGT